LDPEILAILITVKGAQQAINQINAVKGEMTATVEQTKLLSANLKIMAAEAITAFAALVAAGSDESMRLQLQGITHDASLAQRQIQAIRGESELGLFDKKDIFEATKLFDETHSSIKKLLPLTEELSLRTGGSLQESAKALSSLEGGGIGRLQSLLKNAGISIKELRDAGLAIDTKFKISSTPAQTLEALSKVLGKNNLGSLLGDSFDADIKKVIASVKDLFRSIGDGLLPVSKPVLGFLTGMLKTLTYINDLTHGMVGDALLFISAWMSLSKVIPLLLTFVNLEKISAIWAIVLKAANAPWATLAGFIGTAVTALKAFATMEKLAAAWAAILDALDGNWVALGVGAAVAAAVGVAWYFGNQDHSAAGDNPGGGWGGADNPPAERPSRRSDIENMMHRTRANSFA